jgi:putative membrane protein
MATDQHRAAGAASDQGGDGTRRTYLANERTFLAWWRTGVTALAASIGVGRVVPSLTHQHRWPYAILGVGFALIGIGTIAYGLKRDREVRDAITRGDFVQPRSEVLAALTAAGAILGILLLVVIVVQL